MQNMSLIIIGEGLRVLAKRRIKVKMDMAELPGRSLFGSLDESDIR